MAAHCRSSNELGAGNWMLAPVSPMCAFIRRAEAASVSALGHPLPASARHPPACKPNGYAIGGTREPHHTK
eukprot:14176374-Alexandrium_andersonii.AAC.1